MSGPGSDGDWRLKVGKIAPTIWDNADQYAAMMVDGVDLVVTTLGVQNYSQSEMAGAREQRATAAELLVDWNADVVLAGGTPVAASQGPKAETAFIEETTDRLGVPFTSTMAAQTAALQALEASTVVMISPFPEERTRDVEDYLEARGFDVVATGGCAVEDPRETRKLPRTAAYRYTMETVADLDEAFDAVFVPVPPFGSVEHVQALEADTDRPVIMGAQAQVWAAYEMTNVRPSIEGYGQLFETL